jgi:Tol biopolymer transport system component
VPSPDGRYIYYNNDEASGSFSVYRIPVQGGAARHLFDSLIDNYWPVEDGIYFVPMPARPNDHSLQFLSTVTGDVQRIASFEGPITVFSVSPDRQHLLYSQREQTNSDLMLVENFR